MNGTARFPAPGRHLIAGGARNGARASRGQIPEATARTPTRWSAFEALAINPHALALHQAIWETLSHLKLAPALVERYADLAHDAIFYVDPHICVRCRYRSTELLWQCPHCHEWNTFVEERIAPAKDTEATLTN